MCTYDVLLTLMNLPCLHRTIVIINSAALSQEGGDKKGGRGQNETGIQRKKRGEMTKRDRGVEKEVTITRREIRRRVDNKKDRDEERKKGEILQKEMQI